MAKSAVSLKFAKPVSNGALASEALPSRIKILGWGVNKTLDGEVILDETSAKCFYANQRSIGRTQAPLDFNHNTVPGTKAYESDKEPRAIAGYGIPTLVANDGLYYEYMQYTPSGEKSAKDFADLSPAVITDSENRVIGLHSCALTPAGAIENLTFYSAENLGLYSADSMPNLMDKCTVKANSAKGDDDGDDDDEDEESKKEKAKEKKLKAMAADDHKSEYGDVAYADPDHHKYPIDTEAHVRAAWSYIHMPKNQTGYDSGAVAKIKDRIAARAKHYGIELKANSADGVRTQVNAYVSDPYTPMDAQFKDMMDEFRKKLGLADTVEETDVLKAIRAKWDGFEDVKNPLPRETEGADPIDPTRRGGPEGMSTGEKGTPHEGGAVPHGTVTYSTPADIEKILDAKLQPLSAKFSELQAERDAKAKQLEKEQRSAIVAEATRLGKVIPFSAEEIEKLDIPMLQSCVKNLKAGEVNFGRKAGIKPLSADGKVPPVAPGARERAAQSMTQYFNSQGLTRGEGWVGFDKSGEVIAN